MSVTMKQWLNERMEETTGIESRKNNLKIKLRRGGAVEEEEYALSLSNP